MKSSIFLGAAVATLFAAGTASAQQNCDWVSTCSGFSLDSEVLMLRWSDTDGDDSNDNLTAGYRFTAGYAFEGGRILRLRYFGFQSPDEVGPGELDLKMADVEYAARFNLATHLDGEVSVGARWASMANPTPRDWDSLYGPILGARFRSELVSDLAIYAGARAGYLWGHENVEDHTHPVSMAEVSAGLEWSKRTEMGAVSLHGGVEVQHYNSVRDDEEDISLIGFSVGGGVNF